jgi:hypothetical protein
MLHYNMISTYPVAVHIQKQSHILFERKMKLKANKLRDESYLPPLKQTLPIFDFIFESWIMKSNATYTLLMLVLNSISQFRTGEC